MARENNFGLVLLGLLALLFLGRRTAEAAPEEPTIPSPVTTAPTSIRTVAQWAEAEGVYF